MPITSVPPAAALTKCPGPITAMSISPATSAETASGERGMRIYWTSNPYFLNRPRSLAIQTAAMLSLVMLEAKFERICADNCAGKKPTVQKKIKRTRQRERGIEFLLPWSGSAVI
jgi:hypothetical protein